MHVLGASPREWISIQEQCQGRPREQGSPPQLWLFTDLPDKHPTLPPTHNTALDVVTTDPH